MYHYYIIFPEFRYVKLRPTADAYTATDLITERAALGNIKARYLTWMPEGCSCPQALPV